MSSGVRGHSDAYVTLALCGSKCIEPPIIVSLGGFKIEIGSR